MGFIAEKLRKIHDGTTESDSRARIGFALAAETATNLIIIANVQPAEVALGSVILLSAVTIFEGWHQAKNRDMRDDLTATLEPDEARKFLEDKARSEFQEG